MLTQAEVMKAEAKDFDPVKAMKEIADLLTPLGDGIRVVTGQDPITGEKLSGSERGLSALFIIPHAKIGKYGAKGFKFVTEGVEDLNKLNKKADKVKDVEKSTKKASGADVPKLSTLSEAEKLKIANQYKQTAPIGIPDSAKINAKTMNAGYEQITYKWNDGQFKYEVRWHTRTPGAPIEQGNTWVVQRTVPGNGGNKPQTFFKIGDNEWIEGYKLYDAINARKAGNATPEQIKILDKGHWKE